MDIFLILAIIILCWQLVSIIIGIILHKINKHGGKTIMGVLVGVGSLAGMVVFLLALFIGNPPSLAMLLSIPSAFGALAFAFLLGHFKRQQ